VQAEEISDHFGLERIYRVTGQPEVAPTWPACKILWLRHCWKTTCCSA
jgi:hypothetical protein